MTKIINRTKNMTQTQEKHFTTKVEFELFKYGRDFLKENYPHIPMIPVKVNGRLSRALGRYMYQRTGQAKGIEISKNMIKHYPKEEILDTMRHELTHYALHYDGKPFFDGHPVFESELIKNNASSTRTKKFRGIKEVIEYKCSKCNIESFTYTKAVAKNPNRYRTRCCSGDLIITKVEQKVFN